MNPKDKEDLFAIVEELVTEEETEDENLIDKLISIIKSSDLSNDELKAYIKSISNRGLTGDLKNKLSKKGYTSDSFKVGDKAIGYIIDKITDSEAKEFIDYTPKSFASAPDRGNFAKVNRFISKSNTRFN